jgi:hypothetical protein
MTVRKLFQLTVNLLIWLSLLAATAFLRPSGLLSAQAAPPGSPPSLAQAGLRSEAPAVNIIYVNKHASGPTHNGGSWATAFLKIQDALDIAVANDQIWVASGVYTPTHQILVTDTRTATFSLLEAVQVYGSFRGNETSLSQRTWRLNPTILSGDLSGNDLPSDFPNGATYSENAYHVVTADYLNQPTRLDGFIIQGGNANIQVEPSNYGGGIYNRESATHLVNLIFYKNFARQGGGLYNVDTYSLIINCAFIGNKSNFGGGLRNIHSNTTIINSVFVGNTAYVAGALYNSNSNPTIVNTTIAYNYGDDAFPEPIVGGVLNDTNSLITIKNSILWGNYPGQIKNESEAPASSAELYYSLVQDDCTGFGNSCTGMSYTTDPFFENPPGLDGIIGTLDDNLHVTKSSPAMNAGDNGVVPLDDLDINYNGVKTENLPFDLNNNGRFALMGDSYTGSGTPPIVDLGAYEVQYKLFLPTVSQSSH